MATASSTSKPKALPSRLRTVRNVVIGVLVLAVLWAVWHWNSIKGQAELGAAYGARMGCACRYIEGRDIKSCESDFEDGMGMVSLSDDPEHKRVEASVPFLADAMAERHGKFGCVMLNETEMEAAD